MSCDQIAAMNLYGNLVVGIFEAPIVTFFQLLHPVNTDNIYFYLTLQ